jgi:iron complex outermembrane receptor protein
MTGATTAVAQQADVEEIIVTGSRIRQNPLESRTPVMNLSEADIERSGRTSVADYLGQLAITGSAINAANNTSGNLGFPPDGGGIGAGQAEVDLRNLTSKRTLVLVDGRRWISGTSASGVSVAVDLNSIPVGAIERIEVLQDGASPIYGSDAIAGVVNIITKREYDGLQASAYFGAFDEGDGEVQEYELSFGASGERSRLFLDVSYTKSEEVLAADRAISEFPISGFPGCTSSCSSGTPQARVFFFPPGGATADITLNDGVVNDGGLNIPAFDPLIPGTLDFHDFTTSDRFNFQPFNFLKTPNTRINIFAKGEYDVTDDITFNVTASYNNRRSANQAAPEPLFIGPDAGNGNLMDTIGVDITNPFNPFGVTLDGFAGGNFVFAGRRPIEAGPRLFKQNVDTWTVMGSLTGEANFGGKAVYWDFGVSWAQAQANQRKFGAFNSLKLKQALGPLADCVEVDGDGDGIDDVTGCTPFNFFGGQGANDEGSITPEMLNFVGFIQKDESQQQMFVVTANVTGDIFDLPAGSVGYAFGYEHRKQEGFFTPDAIVTAGNTAGVPSFPTAGQFNVDEFYGELNIPLIADAPFAERLELNAAIRVSDYNLFGSDSVFKIGGNWRVTEDLLIRGNYSEGFRAPGIGELFNTGSRFDSTLPDPCSDMLGLSGGPVADATTIANCTTLGVPADGSYVQFNAQIGVNTGGSLDLTPESSDSFTIGIVYDPSWAADIAGLESLTIEANYYDISVNNAIQAPVALDQLTACIATLEAALCDGINRTPTGVINAFENQLGNIGGIDTSGFDWTVTIVTEDSGLGQFRLTWDNTLLDKYTETLQTPTTVLTFQREGTELGSPERGFNKYKSTLVLDWFMGDFSASFVGRYLSGLDESCPSGVIAADPTLCTDAATAFHRIPSVIYSDIQISWSPSRWDNNVTLTLGVNNVFDADIPVCFTCDLNSFDGTLNPIPGQFGYARLSFRM